MLPINLKELNFFQGNLELLQGNFEAAQTSYRNCIKSDPNQILLAQTLNNLGCSSWFKAKSTEKSKKGQEKESDDLNYVIANFKDSIETFEDNEQSLTGEVKSVQELQLIQKLYGKDSIIPDDFS